MKRKFLVLTLSALASLTACGFGGGGSTEVDQQLPKDDPTNKVEINFWHCLGSDKSTNLNKIVKAFNTQYEGKYEVKLVHVGGDYDDLHDNVKTKLAAGEIPALTMGYPDSFAEYISNDITKSSILRLENFINDTDYGYSAAEISDFVSGYYAEGTGYQFEGTWSMPMYKSTEVMYYNKSYFKGDNMQNLKKFEGNQTFLEKYNLVHGRSSSVTRDDELAGDLNDLEAWCKANGGYTYEIPTTWEEMIALGKQMMADKAAQNIPGEFYPIGYDSDANLFITQFAQKGIPYTDAKSENKFLFNNPEAVALVKDILQDVKDKVMITKGSINNYTNKYFSELKTVMSIGSTGGSSYQISSNFEVGLAPVPCREGCPKKYIQQGPSICFFDNENPYIHKGAWLFYKAMADAENNSQLALENSYDPIRKSSYTLPSYTAWTSKGGRGVLKYDIPNQTAQLTEFYYTSDTFVGSGTARTEMSQLIPYTYLNGMTVENALQLAYATCVSAA